MSYDAGGLWRLHGQTVGLDGRAGAGLLSFLVLALDSGFLGDRHCCLWLCVVNAEETVDKGEKIGFKWGIVRRSEVK